MTRGGLGELDVPLVLRPTSETAIYPVFAMWVRSHRDLPLNVYQIVNVFRYETKTTRPFLRVREIHFFEEHTCQRDEAEATARLQSNLGAFARMAEAFALPYVAVRRPEWDKFPGAFATVAFDIPVGGGRALQIGSIHHYRDNFAGPYNIRYEALDGSQRLVHQTTFGLSERLLGAIVAVHGDARGAVFPSTIAPHEVVIVPIPSAGDSGAPGEAARAAAERLKHAGRRVRVDDGEERPGAKYYRWETRGVPLRLEVGRREAEAKAVTAVDRLGHREKVALDRLEEEVGRLLRAFDARLVEKARSAFAEAFVPVRSVEELAGLGRIAVVTWCGREECGHRIEEATNGSLLGTPEGDPPLPLGPPGACVVCGATEGARWALAGRSL